MIGFLMIAKHVLLLYYSTQQDTDEYPDDILEINENPIKVI